MNVAKERDEAFINFVNNIPQEIKNKAMIKCIELGINKTARRDRGA